MKTALVIGGTKGFRKAISDRLQHQNFNVYTIGRSKNSSFQCDISDKEMLAETLNAIKNEIPTIDTLACVTGFARAKESEKLTDEDWQTAFQCNLGYVNQSLDILADNLYQSDDHRVITIGSRWSLRRDCPFLLPYIEAKHQLKDFVKSKNDEFMISCYCVPPMQTPGLSGLLDSFKRLGYAKLPIDSYGDINVIANNIIDHNLRSQESGETYRMNPQGIISRV